MLDIYDEDEPVFQAPSRVWLSDSLAIYPTREEEDAAYVEFITQLRNYRERHPLQMQ